MTITVVPFRVRYPGPWGSGLGQFDASAVAQRQAELQQIRAERQRVEAELAVLQGRAPAPAPPVRRGEEIDVAIAEMSEALAQPRKKKVPVVWIAAAVVAGLFVLRSL